jgi:hypothetical protein
MRELRMTTSTVGLYTHHLYQPSHPRFSMGMDSLWKMLVPVCLLMGCGSGQAPQPKPAENTVFDPPLQQEQRARDVQKTVDANAERTRKAVDAQARGEESP